MASNTLRTILGFFRSVLERRFPGLRKQDSLAGVFNYVSVSELVATSGQPDETQLVQIANAGYGTVINLAPTSVIENSVVDERGILENCGVTYIHIPVDFRNPTESEFRQFISLMDERANEPVWVNCAANMRVSAFIYRYRCSVLGHDVEEAREDLQKIWEPFGVWKEFVAR